jgi:hypothetical protein
MDCLKNEHKINLERFPFKYNIFLFSLYMNKDKNQPRIELSHSVLSLFYFESHYEFSRPFRVESLTVLSLFYVESHSEFSTSQFSPF